MMCCTPLEYVHVSLLSEREREREREREGERERMHAVERADILSPYLLFMVSDTSALASMCIVTSPKLKLKPSRSHVQSLAAVLSVD